MPRKFLLAFILSILVFQPVSASENNLKLLFLSSYAAELPWSTAVQNGISEMISEYGKPVILYNEYLDDMRLSSSLTIDERDWYLSIKYKNAKIDAIMIDADPATEIFQKISNYFPGIPKILIDPGETIAMGEDIILLPNNDLSSVNNTFAMALKQKPKTENIYVVDGQVKTTEAYLEKLLKTASEHGYSPTVFQDFDTGIVLNEDFNIETGSSLGMKIIRETVTSLSGEIDHSGNSGTSFNIKFPLYTNQV